MRSGFGWIVLGGAIVGLLCGFAWGYFHEYFFELSLNPPILDGDDLLISPTELGMFCAVAGGGIGLVIGCILAGLLAFGGWLRR
jgi:hypothetical protein